MQKAVDLSETGFLTTKLPSHSNSEAYCNKKTAPQDNPYRVTTSVPSFSGISYAETFIFVPQIFGFASGSK